MANEDEKNSVPKVESEKGKEQSRKVTEFVPGQVLFRQGSRGGPLYFIIEGEIELMVRDDESGKETVIAKAGPRSILGTMTFLEGDPRSTTATCLTACKCIVVDQYQREKLLSKVPEWFKALLKDMSGNLRKTNEEFAKLSAKYDVLEKRYQILKDKTP